MNNRRVNKGLEVYSNPRNTNSSGTIKLLDSNEVSNRPLDCFLYYLIEKIYLLLVTMKIYKKQNHGVLKFFGN